MDNTNISSYERETIILFNDAENTATIYTCSPKTMKKLDERVGNFPNIYKVIKETHESKTYSCPKKMIGFRKPVIMTEERRREASERFRAFWAEKKKGCK